MRAQPGDSTLGLRLFLSVLKVLQGWCCLMSYVLLVAVLNNICHALWRVGTHRIVIDIVELLLLLHLLLYLSLGILHGISVLPVLYRATSSQDVWRLAGMDIGFVLLILHKIRGLHNFFLVEWFRVEPSNQILFFEMLLFTCLLVTVVIRVRSLLWLIHLAGLEEFLD